MSWFNEKLFSGIKNQISEGIKNVIDAEKTEIVESNVSVGCKNCNILIKKYDEEIEKYKKRVRELLDDRKKLISQVTSDVDVMEECYINWSKIKNHAKAINEVDSQNGEENVNEHFEEIFKILQINKEYAEMLNENLTLTKKYYDTVEFVKETMGVVEIVVKKLEFLKLCPDFAMNASEQDELYNLSLVSEKLVETEEQLKISNNKYNELLKKCNDDLVNFRELLCDYNELNNNKAELSEQYEIVKSLYEKLKNEHEIVTKKCARYKEQNKKMEQERQHQIFINTQLQLANEELEKEIKYEMKHNNSLSSDENFQQSKTVNGVSDHEIGNFSKQIIKETLLKLYSEEGNRLELIGSLCDLLNCSESERLLLSNSLRRQRMKSISSEQQKIEVSSSWLSSFIPRFRASNATADEKKSSFAESLISYLETESESSVFKKKLTEKDFDKFLADKGKSDNMHL